MSIKVVMQEKKEHTIPIWKMEQNSFALDKDGKLIYRNGRASKELIQYEWIESGEWCDYKTACQPPRNEAVVPVDVTITVTPKSS